MKKKISLFIIMLVSMAAHSQTPAVVVIDSIVVPSGSEYVIGDTVGFSFNLHNVGPFATVNPITIKYKLSEGLHFLSSLSSDLFHLSGDTVIGIYSTPMAVGAKHNFFITFDIRPSSCPSTFVGGNTTECGGDGFLTISGGSELSSGFLRWREWTNWGTGGKEDFADQKISLYFPVGQATPTSICGGSAQTAPAADITYYYDDDHTVLNPSVISKTLSSSSTSRITWEWYGVMVPDETTQYTFCGSNIDDGWAAWISNGWDPYAPQSIDPMQMTLANENYNYVAGESISTGNFSLVCGRPYFYRIVVSSRNACSTGPAGFSNIALRKTSASTCTQNWSGMMSAKINIPIKLNMNCPPVAVNDSIVTDEDYPISGNLFVNDTDPNDDIMYISKFLVDTNGDSVAESFTPSSSAVITNIGTFSLQSNGAYTFTPAHDYHGALPSITYISWDGPGNGGYDTATVFITVFEVPDAGNDILTTDEDVPSPIDLFANDNDVPTTSGTLTFLDQDNGTIVVDNNGTPGNLSDDSFTYVPRADFAGKDTIYYIICNIYSNCDTGMFVATVTPVTDIVPDTVSLCENDTIKIDVLSNDGFSGHHAISAVSLPVHGTVTVNADTTFRYIPNTNYNGTDTFTYKVTIMNGDLSTSTETALVNITVNPSYSLSETAIDTVIFCTAPYYYNGIIDDTYRFDSRGTKDFTFTTDKGCDSVVKVVAYYNDAAQSDYNFTFTAPADIDTVILFGHHTFAISDIGTATYNHFLSSVPGVGIHISNNAPAVYLPGTNYVTWTVRDTCGNTLTAVQKIYVHYPPCGGSVVATDYESTTYESVLIGAYCWTKSNLKSTKYSDGSDIPVASIYQSDLYGDTTSNLTKYGRLYSWYSAVKIPENSSISPDTNGNGNVPGVCPDGWYLPSETEYQDILSYGSDALKSSSGWLNGNNGSNTTGFTSFPGGMYNGSSSSFVLLLGEAYYWTSDIQEGNPVCYSIFYSCPDITFHITLKSDGYSVRCVKENEISRP